MESSPKDDLRNYSFAKGIIPKNKDMSKFTSELQELTHYELKKK
jgi:hypothetical protein